LHDQRKGNFAASIPLFSIQLVNGHGHTPIDENRPFSVVHTDRRHIATSSLGLRTTVRF